MAELTPQEIVAELDRYVIGQQSAKKALAVALRNRYRRRHLAPEIAAEVMPKNILMIGPTGVGKTELARRLARLHDAPFIKVEATKFTEVGYVGRDVESIVRDLLEAAINLEHESRQEEVKQRAEELAEERIVEALLSQSVPELVAKARTAAAELAKREQAQLRRRRKALAAALSANKLDEQVIEIETEAEDAFPPIMEFISTANPEELSDSIQDFVSHVAQHQQRKRSKQMSVREARRLLTAEESNKLINWDAVIDAATSRVEEAGIVFLDEIDKIARPAGHETTVDISGEGVQRDLLPLIEGSTVMTRYGPVRTEHILFICAGSFHHAKPSDLIPELQGRLPLRVELETLTEESFVRILMQPDNALTKQYQALMGVEGVELDFTDDGLREIAHVAVQANDRLENIGARRLHTVVERVLEELSFDASNRKGQAVTVDREYVLARLADLVKDEDLGKYIL